MSRSSKTIQGIGVSPGIAIGKAYVIERGQIPISYYTLADQEAVDDECDRFEAAIVKTERDLDLLKERLGSEYAEQAYILDVQRMILRDRMLYDETLRFIREEKLNAQWALKHALLKAYELFEALEDEYIRTRIADVESVGERVLRELAGQAEDILQSIRERVIVVAQDLSPADTAQLQLERTLGLVTDMGGRTSHTAIIARSLGIPAVVGAERATRSLRTGSIVIMDGALGQVIVNPTDEEISDYYERQEELENYLKEISRKSHLEARTQDDYRIRVEANIELLEEFVAAKDNGAEGIGLYRTEFFYMNRADLPDEDTLYNEYRELAELMAPHPVTMRTLDLGAEKVANWFPKVEETNPALGLRSVRLCLHYRELFKTQLRAILRASAVAENIRLMFPLISGLGELREAKKVLKEVQEEFVRKRIPLHEGMPVGAMIEVPSAVAIADLLAKEVDFFSIGTNDLIQYSLAIDRVNEHVAYLYEPLHPGVLRLIKHTVDAGHNARIPVTVCGEMAGEPLYITILLGLELDSLSMNPQAIPRVKNLIRRSTLRKCRAFLQKILEMGTAREISDLLQELVLREFPEEFRYFDPSALRVSGAYGNTREDVKT